MPTYEYVCSSCGYEFDEFQQMTAEHLTVCPKCHQETLVRKIGRGAGLIFKGSGFYATDYRKGKPEGTSTQESKAEESLR
jgi:putative FmdB family regulatory protein